MDVLRREWTPIKNISRAYEFLNALPSNLRSGEFVRVMVSGEEAWVGELVRYTGSLFYDDDWRVPVGFWRIKKQTGDVVTHSIAIMRRASHLEALGAQVDENPTLPRCN